MDDIRIPVPAHMPLPVDASLAQAVAELANLCRRDGSEIAREELAKDPNARINITLALLKLMLFPRHDQTMESLVEGSLTVECSRGCATCCHQAIAVTIPEAILVAINLADPADPRHRAVLETAAAVEGLGNRDRMRTGRPCPLLVDNACSVYEDRPIVCRAYLSPNAQRCKTAFNNLLAGSGDLTVESYPVPQYFGCGHQAAMQGICKDLGLQHDIVDLTQAVAAVLQDPAIIGRWAAGEQVFKPTPSAEPANGPHPGPPIG